MSVRVRNHGTATAPHRAAEGVRRTHPEQPAGEGQERHAYGSHGAAGNDAKDKSKTPRQRRELKGCDQPLKQPGAGLTSP